MKKRVLSLLLVLVMAVGMLPVSAMAAEGEPAPAPVFQTNLKEPEVDVYKRQGPDCVAGRRGYPQWTGRRLFLPGDEGDPFPVCADAFQILRRRLFCIYLSLIHI